MKKLSILSLVLLLSIILITADIFATGISLTGVGGRASVFGGAFRGLANDWSAAYWNPAGLVQINNMQFGGSIELISPNATYNAARFSGQNFGVLYRGDLDGKDLNFFVPAAGFVYRTGQMAFGLSVFAPFGLGTEWDLFNTEKYNSNYPELDYDDNLQVIDIHPTFAYQVSDKLSVGAGISIIHSDIRIQMPRMIPNPYFYNPALAQLKAAFLAAGGTFTPENKHVMTNLELDGSGWGFGGNIGLLYKATDDLQIGVSARYYADQELSGSFTGKAFYVKELNPTNRLIIQGMEPTLNGLLALGVISEAQHLLLKNIYSGGSDVMINEPSAKATMPLPMNIGIGFAYTGVENMLFTFDVDFTQWSTWDVIEISLTDGTESLTENWHNVYRVAFGCEYTKDKLKLRGGFYAENAAAVNETFSPSIPDVGHRFVVAGGFGYNFGAVDFHLHGEYFFITDRDIVVWTPNASNTGYDNLAGKYSAKNFVLMAGFDYTF